MPVIKIDKIATRTKTSAKGKKYKVKTIEGVKYGSDEPWSVDVFINQTDLLEELDEFSPGELVNVKFKKNGNFYDVVGFEEPDAELIQKIDSGEFETPAKKTTGGKGSTSGGGARNSSMSKEEWAEKDRLTNIRIAKAVALKAAVDNTKMGTDAKALMEFADKLLPYLMNTKVPEKVADKGKDALDPPTE